MKINKPKIVALIPARGGSISIPNKNLVNLGNKPLIQWSIDLAKKILPNENIYVSSDNIKILNFALKNKIMIQKRPKKLSTSSSLVIDTVNYFCKEIAKKEKPIDIIIFLEPTSPFRKSKVIRKALNRLIKNNLDSISSFIPSKTLPERQWIINKSVVRPLNNKLCWTPRQKLNKKFELDGSIFIFKTNKNHKNNIIFGKKGSIILKSEDVIEIDNLNDLDYARFIIKKRKFLNDL